MPIGQIARLVGHTGGSTVTETIYRKQLRPVIEDGATVMDTVFARRPTTRPRTTPAGTSPRPSEGRTPGR